MASTTEVVSAGCGRLPFVVQRAEAEAEGRMQVIRGIVDGEGTAVSKYWSLVQLLDDWEWDDSRLDDLPLPGNKKRRTDGQVSMQSPPPACAASSSQAKQQSPPPVATEEPATSCDMGSSSPSGKKVLDERVRLIIEENKQKALARREQRQQAAKIHEAMQWMP